jgi:HEAT repeat protein
MKERVKDLIKDKNLRTKLENIIRKVGEEFEPGNVGDTLQGFQHFETVDKNLANIIVKTGKDIEFSDMELFLLGASPYLHDLLKPSSAWGFLSHGGKVMEAVTDKPELYGLDDRAEAIAIGWISAAHSSRSLDNTEWGRVPEKYAVGSEEVNLRELAAIFLLADTLDTTTSRAPEMMSHIHYQEKFPDEKPEGKWMARQAITGWYIKEEKMVLQAHPRGFDEREAVLGAKTMMERDLSEVKPLLKSLGFPCELELEMEVIFLKGKAIAEIQESRPFKGMDFYDESDTGLFKGRKGDVGRVEDHIYAYPITLLAGSSGVGKTSLIHAGMFPKLKIAGWECIYLRPFDDLYRMVKSIKRIYSVEAESLGEAFRNLDEKLKKKILVVIDQFEDVLNWHAEIFEELILDFCSIHGLENPKLLVVLRSDALCDLNRKIFKKVMTNGFPTVELGGLGGEGAREALNAGFKAGKMVLHPAEFIDEILNDLIYVSPFDEVYPPYLQMVGEELCKHADEKRKLILKNAYYELGRARGIVARYLFRKLDEFGEDKENAIKILKSLVSYAGGKTQKSVSEIGAETGIPRKEFEELLKRLVNERMIRKLDGAIYEIIHDYFGELINKELVGEKERHIKYLREQLNAAIAAFERNKALMHCQILAELYRYRREVPVDESAYKVLLATWCTHKFPAWYWLRNAENKKIIEIVIELCEHPMIEVKKNASDLLVKALIKEGNQNHVRKLLTRENVYVQEAAVNAFAKLVRREDLPIIREMLKDRSGRVREAAVKAIAELGRGEDLPIIREMLKDRSGRVRKVAFKAIAELGRGEDLPIIREMLKDDDWRVRKAAVKAIAELVSGENLPLVREMLKDDDWRVREAAAVAELVSGENLPLVREMLKDDDWRVRKVAVKAIAKLVSGENLPLVREMLKDDDWGVRKVAVKAIAKLVSGEDLPLVREMLKDDDWRVREAAVKAIAELGSEEDMSIIREMLKDDNRAVQEAAVKAIAELGSEEDMPIIRGMLKDDNRVVQEAAVKAIAELGSEEDLDRLAEASAETCAVMEEPMEALGRLDWKLYSLYALSEN